MKQGHGANALGHAALGSMIGGVIGALLLILLTPLAARASLLIQTSGKFSLVLFALVVIVIAQRDAIPKATVRSEEHTSELQSLMRISYAVFCLKKKKPHIYTPMPHEPSV